MGRETGLKKKGGCMQQTPEQEEKKEGRGRFMITERYNVA